MNRNASSEPASPHYHGPIDRVYASLREVYGVDEFIDRYLRSRGYALSDDNRRLVGGKLEAFGGRVPFLQQDLTAFLDHGWTR